LDPVTTVTFPASPDLNSVKIRQTTIHAASAQT